MNQPFLLVLASAIGVALLLGAALLYRGLRGRRIDNHPVCRACRFDLSGVFPARDQCPECGARLSSPRAVVAGNRRRRRGVAALGAALLALALAGGFLLSFGVVGSVRWQQYAPTWFLRAQLSGAASSDEAMQVLLDRLNAKRLSSGQVSGIADAALARQANAALPWPPLWGDFVEAAEAAALLTPAQVDRYLKQAAPLEFMGRPRVEAGGVWPYRLKVGPGRCGTGGGMSISITTTAVSIDGNEFSAGGASMSGLSATGWSAMGSRVTLKGVEPGPHRAAGRWTLSATRSGARKAPIATWTFDATLPIEVVPPGGDVVELVTDPAMREWVVRSTRAEQCAVSGDHASGYIYFDSSPVPAAYDVFWAVPEPDGGRREVRLGSVSVFSPTQTHGCAYSGTLPPGVRPATVDVILRPSAAAARGTVDVTRIWGEEVVIRGAKVKVEDGG